MSTKEQKVKVDADYSLKPVPRHASRNIVTMFMIMLGFTFFSASMWTGQELGIGLDLKGFVEALLLGGAILGIYTALLAYVGCKTGLSMDLLAQHSFGKKGSYLPSALISFTQIGWFGVGVAMFAIPVAKLIAPDKPWVVPLLVALAGICMTGSAFFGIRAMTIVSYISVPLIAMLGITAMIMAVRQGDASLAEKFAESQGLGVITGAGMVIGSFVSGGTATPNFARFAKTPKAAVWTTAIAFFLGNSLMFCFGAFSGVYVGGNDIFEVMIALNLTVFAIIVLGLNIWTTNDNALYSAGLGLSNITKIKKSPLVLISGALGTVAAIWLYNNFTGWLNILNCTLPPVGAILILGYFCHKEDYDQDKENTLEVNWFAIAGVILGAVVANVVPVGIASINGMAVAVVCYLVGFAAGRKK
ncbi:cytosine permease [Eisenbergiella porci]|uniref:cytosine permease n=1 Tax=Eisenbergiella porci TaxID=2652274 RepID=UPI002A80D928|nr:cytosine permease [Eisenbergiella porci]